MNGNTHNVLSNEYNIDFPIFAISVPTKLDFDKLAIYE